MAKIAWGITGGGHLLKESLDAFGGLENADLFVSPAGMEVLDVYSLEPPVTPITDSTFSTKTSVAFASGVYDLFVIAPATSNSVGKFVCGISDTMITTLFAQCGKSRVPIIVLPTDTEETVMSMGATKPLEIYPRPIDLENAEKIKTFPSVSVVRTIEELLKKISETPGRGV